jgi:NAD(P)-dependent dehydrogenase (short-subunit alcohol dehydrogenase family)
MKDLAGKVAFITGGGSGVALGQAKAFAAQGMKIVIADIRRDHLDSALAYFRENKLPAHGIQLDITDRKAYAPRPTKPRRCSVRCSCCAIPPASASSVRCSRPPTTTGTGRCP